MAKENGGRGAIFGAYSTREKLINAIKEMLLADDNFEISEYNDMLLFENKKYGRTFTLVEYAIDDEVQVIGI
ncbi:MAG: hypothetical protein ACRC5M_00265 [Anaeroplasmataceae bacterium]